MEITVLNSQAAPYTFVEAAGLLQERRQRVHDDDDNDDDNDESPPGYSLLIIYDLLGKKIDCSSVLIQLRKIEYVDQ